ncbi:MAG: MFS transporter [Acidimicrobiia bacterium]|jgi:EmrB/QacA subfamily drug resistance transporter
MHPDLSPGRRRAVLAAMCLALVLVVAGVSMLSVSLPTMATALGASQSAQQWIIDAYALALAALLLPAGALGDRFGRRRALIVGIVLFGGASLLSAWSDTPSQLIGWRALAGVGAALIMPGTLSTITSVFPPDQRARAVGIWAGFAGAGGVIGLVVAGGLLEVFWWGSIFVFTAVLALVALVAIVLAVPDTSDPEHAVLDPPGAVLSVLGVGGLVLGIIEGPARGWTAPVTLAGLVVGVVSLVAFVLWELHTPRPLLDPRLFRLHGFATGSAALFLLFFAMFGFFFITLQFLQLILGYGTLLSAVALLPIAVVMLPLSTVAATLSERYGMRTVSATGLLLAAGGFAILATLGVDSGYVHLLVGFMLIGCGFALAMSPATNAIVASLPRAKQGVASAVNDTAREMGAALGVAVLGSAFNEGYVRDIKSATGGLPPALADTARDAPAGALAAAGQLGDAGAALTDAAKHAFIVGSRWAMVIGAVLLLVGAVYVRLRAPGAELARAEDELDADEPDVDALHPAPVGV